MTGPIKIATYTALGLAAAYGIARGAMDLAPKMGDLLQPYSQRVADFLKPTGVSVGPYKKPLECKLDIAVKKDGDPVFVVRTDPQGYITSIDQFVKWRIDGNGCVADTVEMLPKP